MSSACCAFKRLAFLWFFAGIAAAGLAQNSYGPQGGEYPIAGSLPGDQMHPAVALGSNGGILAWQDSVTDGDGLGISARRINANLSGSFGIFRVNQQAAGDQESVRVALLKDGGAVFVWQGGLVGFQHIYARFMKSDGTFGTDDLLVNSYTGGHQIDPAVAVLSNGAVVVTWSSYGQDGSMYGVYSQILASNGDKVGAEFRISESTFLNQRSSSIAALSGGGFASVWVSERASAKSLTSVDGLISVTNPVPRFVAGIYGRIFEADGTPRGAEFSMGPDEIQCANPVVSPLASGGFAAAWGQMDAVVYTNTWDVFVRSFGADGLPVGDPVRLNTYTLGDQIGPKIASAGEDSLVLWTSVGQDGSREGVFGRFMSAAGVPIGGEIAVNTTTVSQQLNPAVASDGAGRFLAVWTSFIGGVSSFDLFAQRYAVNQTLPAPVAPFVRAPFVVGTDGVYQPQLQVSWPILDGLAVTAYEVYVDGASTPTAASTTNFWTLTGIAPASTHSFRLAYATTDGRHSPLSPAAIGSAWSGANYGGIPFEWMTANFGPNVLAWPKPTDDSDGDGASNLHEFLAGTLPKDPASVMRIQLVYTSQGTQLSWNGQPGFIYQVQSSDNLSVGSWTDLGLPRFAAGTSDSVFVPATSVAAYYRVIQLR
jgi:hypothetical protein